LLTLNVLGAADEIFVPLQAEFYSLHGITQLIKVIQQTQKRLNPELKISGIIATMYDGRKNLCREVVDAIQQYFPTQVFQTKIRDTVALAEAPSHSKSIFEYKPDNMGAKDYMELANEILEQEAR